MAATQPPADPDATCRIRGPYYPVGDIDWVCTTHDVEAVRVRGEFGTPLSRSDLACPVQLEAAAKDAESTHPDDAGSDYPDETLVWIQLEHGSVFSGDARQFAARYFPARTKTEIRDWAEDEGWRVSFFDFGPDATGRPLPTDAPQLGAQLREHATRVGLAGLPSVLVEHLWRMADAVDGGRGDHVHHGCPDPQVPTAQCIECRNVLDVEVDGNAPGREGTIFDRAIAD